jgi:hypothetical protein
MNNWRHQQRVRAENFLALQINNCQSKSGLILKPVKSFRNKKITRKPGRHMGLPLQSAGRPANGTKKTACNQHEFRQQHQQRVRAENFVPNKPVYNSQSKSGLI